MPRKKIDASFIDTALWAAVDESVIKDEQQRFNAISKRGALKMRIEGASPSQVEKATGVHRETQARLIARCIVPDDDGFPLGWRACLPGFYVRRRLSDTPKNDVQLSVETLKDKEYSGKFALQALFFRCPEIKEMVHRAVVYSKFEKDDEPRPKSDAVIYRRFIKLCKKRGLDKHGYYPFNVKKKGEEALRTYCARLRVEQTLRAAHANLEATAADQLKFSKSSAIYVFRNPLDRFELDGYKLDCGVNYIWRHPKNGSKKIEALPGLLILALVDSVTTLIVSYTIVYGLNHGVTDILQVIKNIYQPWQPRVFKHLKYAYKADGGLPSGRIPGFRGICFDTLAMDGAMANVSARTRRIILKRVGCAAEYGRRGDKNRRADVEHLFSELATKGFRQLISGTSKHSRKEPKRYAKSLAAKYEVTAEMVEEVAEALVDTWNASRAFGSDVSRMENMRDFLAQPSTLVRYMSEEALNQPWYDRIDYDVRVINERARKLHVNFEGARYYCDALDYSLTTEDIVICADTSDISRIHAYRRSGEFIGELLPEPRWQMPHSLRTRKALLASGSGHEALEDAIDDFNEQLKSQAKLSAKQAADLARMEAEQRKAATNKQSEPESVGSGQESANDSEAQDDDGDEFLANLGSFSRRGVA